MPKPVKLEAMSWSRKEIFFNVCKLFFSELVIVVRERVKRAQRTRLISTWLIEKPEKREAVWDNYETQAAEKKGNEWIKPEQQDLVAVS